MKKVLLVALVVLLVVIGVPVVMPGVGGAYCDDCAPAVAAGGLCLLAVLGGFAAVMVVASQQVRARRTSVRELLRAAVFFRPPRLA